MSDIFDVIADSTRRDIVGVLHEHHRQSKHDESEGTSVSEIVTSLHLSQPTVSKHLKVLRDAELVSVEEKGQHRYYRLQPEPLEQIKNWIDPFLPETTSPAKPSPEDSVRKIAIKVLTDDSRVFANKIGKTAADTAFRIGRLLKTRRPQQWRKRRPQ